MDENKMLREDPVGLYKYYMSQILEGFSLNQDQIIKFAYVEQVATGDN